MIILHRTRERLPSVSATALALLATTLGGCVYRMNIQQGNYLEGKTVDQLQSGMTRSQVRYLLGTPMVPAVLDRKSTRLNSSHSQISYAVFCLKKKKKQTKTTW